MKIVKQLMQSKGSEVWSVEPETKMIEALQLMADKNVGALMVTEGEKLAGIISERDYARKVILKGKSSTDVPVKEIMTSKVFVISPDTSIQECMAFMTEQRIRHLPVLEDDKLVGIITEADFLRALGVPAHQPHHNLWQTLESLFSHLAHHGEPETPDDPVTAHMVKNVVCVHPEQDLHDVIEIMKRNSVKRVVVCDNERRVLGMITRSDLVRVFFDRYTQARS